MAKFIKFAFFSLAVLFLSGTSETKPNPRISYLDDIRLSHNDGIWRCDRLTCPVRATGCHIIRKNVPENKQQLRRTNICLGRANTTIATLVMTEEMIKVRDIDIDFRSYEGAYSVIANGYGVSSQNLNGIVAAKAWPHFQKEARQLMEAVDEID